MLTGQVKNSEQKIIGYFVHFLNSGLNGNTLSIIELAPCMTKTRLKAI